MRVCVKLVLLLFVFFLSTPTIVSVIKKSCDTSSIYSMNEEELAHKEVKAELKCHFTYELPFFATESTANVPSKPIAKHDPVSTRIVIPPPEQV